MYQREKEEGKITTTYLNKRHRIIDSVRQLDSPNVQKISNGTRDAHHNEEDGHQQQLVVGLRKYISRARIYKRLFVLRHDLM